MTGDAEQSNPIEPGTRIGPYRVESFLARGGMGVVVRAVDENLGRPVAIKVIDPKFGMDEEFRARFSRECRVLAAIRHPNIVTIYYQDEYNGAPFFAMELVGGFSLDRILEDMRGLDWRTTVGWMIQCCSALEAARQKDIIHRDLKPGNILIDENNQVRIVDFGLAKQDQVSKELTAASVFLGTPHYVSPEQARGRKLDWRSDLYSLGATFYRVFSGRPVFDAESVPEIVTAHIRDPHQPLADRIGGLPRRLTDLVDRMLSKELDVRGMGSYQATIRELEEIHSEPPDDSPATLVGKETVVGGISIQTGKIETKVESGAQSVGAGTQITSGKKSSVEGPEPPVYAWLVPLEDDSGGDVGLLRASVLPFGSIPNHPIFIPDDPKDRRISRRHGAFEWSESGYRLRVEPGKRTGMVPQIRVDRGPPLAEGSYQVGPGSSIDLRGPQLLIEGSHESGLRVRYRGLAKATSYQDDCWYFVLFSQRLVAGTEETSGVLLPSEAGKGEIFAIEVRDDQIWVDPLVEGLTLDDEALGEACPLEHGTKLAGPGFAYTFKLHSEARDLWEA